MKGQSQYVPKWVHFKELVSPQRSYFGLPHKKVFIMLNTYLRKDAFVRTWLYPDKEQGSMDE